MKSESLPIVAGRPKDRPAGLSVRPAGLSVMRGSVSDFVFGFTADPGHDLLEIIRKSRVASQARVDAARQVGDTVGPSEAEHGSQFMQRDLAVLAAEPGGGRSSDAPGMVSDFVLGSYVLCSKPRTKSDTTK